MPNKLQGGRPRACTNCSRAKAKCAWLDNDDDICQRIVSRVPSYIQCRKSGEARRQQKLDNIMSLLTRDQKHSPCPERVTERHPHPNEGPTPAKAQVSYQSLSSAQSSDRSEATGSPQGSIYIASGFQVSFTEADQILQEYITTMLPEFPFVPLPSGNSFEMLKERPLLTKTILWHYWCFLPVGLIEDLGLTRPQRTDNLAFESIVEDAAQLRNDLQPQTKHTRADIRTVLGVYYITSTLCSLLGKRYRLEYIAHLDDCSRQLLHGQEYPSDLLLVHLVGVQKIAMKVNDSFWGTISITNDGPLGGVYSLAVASIQNELDKFMHQLPVNLKWNHLLRTHCAAVRIRLFEPFKYGNRGDMLEPTHLRCQTIWNCLQSTQAIYDAFRLVPVQFYPSLTFISILHAALAIIKACRLLCIEDQAWDLNIARTTYNLPGILQQLSKLFDAASNSGSPRSQIILHGRPIFAEYAEAYRGIERWYLTKLSTGVVHSTSILTEPINAYSGEQYGFDFWKELSELTNGLVP
ncbi:hypothetical protein BO78DRAFT_373902 [Aspergillus sclerotiicarbonarius CBS 121057]|uniref:Zn(2)-C6 fungal-type domain-containing protein n=1 Tax=Aspergillus sclerotiicarbonarius (strain CBS 121057 / IBT 28362) TaxID=1448318 RepID=A0A319EBL4_ASPSB|nr:hypothetical protein BO78DRAFT_373902 [Aspergillus sclerotiicarbonarius CBS 121057]